ncbi:MAG: L protein [Huanggang Rhabd tick virus 2]|uniref:RNA-directed RNA polymerase L n=1 Tax=Huanggang Rhabd tick virus 2 TaxID=2972329 RepID=A0A9E7V2G0_9RHAB|nr:MAG: L protein [Huanggang Rhabd tick virus 2]
MKKMDLYDDLDSFEIEADETDDLDSTVIEYLGDIKEDGEGMELINNKDYNLNSPLISDQLDELISYLKSNDNQPDNKTTNWEREEMMIMKRVLKNFNDLRQIKESNLLHKMFGKLLNRTVVTNRYNQVGEDLRNVIRGIEEIPKSFFRGLGMTDDIASVDIERKWNDIPLKAKSWFLKFFEFHKLVCVLNANSKMELDDLQKKEKLVKINIENLGYKNHKCYLMDLETTGRWIVFDNYAYSETESAVLNREFILMMKDVLISRFQTILSMEVCHDEYSYTENDIENLMRLYEYGDEILTTHGNRGYKGIKLLESICNLRIVQIVRESRPLIPEFPNFENHIYHSINELLQERGIDLSKFSNVVLNEQTIDMVLVYYSSFRHFGHPFIDYLAGLEKLESQVNKDCHVDIGYANLLASDLAFKVIRKIFCEKKKWPVKKDQVHHRHKFYNHIKHNTWPTQQLIEEFGDHWHELPLDKCFDIPDMIDISILYSDKSHSLDRSEVLKIIKEGNNRRIPTKRVLQSLLDRPATNWPEFLQKVNDHGLDWEKLVIGLKAKERELKEEGRFFSLMSYELRDYFVATEYLIKKYYVPLFEGLTMADDLNTVIKKMLDVSSGQGTRNYDYISIANNIDYEKWNNYQRKESNGPVFKVMGQFLGMENLILRTHEFFENSLIYYNQRADLMMVQGRQCLNKTGIKVCWEGQKGGLEGLRQKGWSILNYLMIERESKIRNTKVKILAQGDNQTISMHYKTESWQNEEELKNHIERMVENNNQIMEAIINGTNKLGLRINHDETMTSADYINYGKVPIIEGTIRGLPTKRWSRVNFTSNDQLPSTSTVLNSSATNALTVAHFSERPIDAIIGQLVLGSLGLIILDYHNPALRKKTSDVVKEASLQNRLYNILLMYLDPSVGGIGGTSLTRYFIRGFPDGVTEALSFWKMVYENTEDDLIRRLCCSIGEPDLNSFKPEDLDKLIEKPESLNIKHGLSSSNMIKGEVKKNLVENCGKIKNEIIQDAARNLVSEETQLFLWLRTISPLFPRFLSQFAESTYYGVTKGLISLFTNSKTIRGIYKKKYKRELDEVLIKSEIQSITGQINIIKKARSVNKNIWKCSAELSDKLRFRSWGKEVLGTTVPHPCEMFGGSRGGEDLCKLCMREEYNNCYLTVMTPKGVPTKCEYRGPYYPYLGSNTKESTSILQPWEKEAKVPVLKRACELRKSINWFVNPNSDLARSIFNNLKALTGEDWEDQVHGYKRTGSSLHRFSCSRVSSGGFAASAPSALTWCISTTDTMCGLGDTNYDFMFQSTIIWCQMLTVMKERGINQSKIYHYHIKCKCCLREISEPELNSNWEYTPRDVSKILEKWRPHSMTEWGETKVHLNIINHDGDWDSLDEEEKSYEVGKTIGWICADGLLSKSQDVDVKSIFPISIRSRLKPKSFLKGVIDGFKLCGTLNLTHRRNCMIFKKPKLAIQGTVFFLIDRSSYISELVNFVSHPNFYHEMAKLPHKVPASYPMNMSDVGSIYRNYMKQIYYEDREKVKRMISWVFSDMRTNELICAYGLSHITHRVFVSQNSTKEIKIMLQQCQDLYIDILNNELGDLAQLEKQMQECLKFLKFVSSEIRHAVKFRFIGNLPELENTLSYTEDEIEMPWGNEYVGEIEYIEPTYYSDPRMFKYEQRIIPYKSNPTISGLRVNQVATGAHYKLRTLIVRMGIIYKDFICGGDGSGGMTSCLLRLSHYSRGLFNSLLVLDDKPLHGTKPTPPSAVLELGQSRNRCVNWDTVWREPSDLSRPETWEYFKKEKDKHYLNVNLIVLDMEAINENVINQIFNELQRNLVKLLEEGGWMIIKTYLSHLMGDETNIIDKVAHWFKEVKICTTNLSSTHTSEVYVVFCDFRYRIVRGNKMNREELWNRREFFKVFKTDKEEFERAKRLIGEPLESGLPEKLRPDKLIELSQMLQISGLDGVTMSCVCQPENMEFFSIKELLLIIVILVSEKYVGTTRKHKENCNCDLETPLSDQDLKRWMGCLISVNLYLSLKNDNFELYRKLSTIVNNDDWNSLCVMKDKENKLKWELSSQKNKLYKNLIWRKRFNLKDKMAYMGNWIRWARRNDSINNKVKSGKINNFLQYINKGLNMKHVTANLDSIIIEGIGEME